MGLLDLPGLLLSLMDGPLDGVLPELARLVLWSLAAGVGCMLLYACVSRQSRLKRLKQEGRAARARLAAYDGDFSGMLALAGENLRIAFRRLGLTLGPALVASLPLLVVAVWMSGTFAYRTPAPGDAIRVAAVGPRDAAPALPDAPRHWQVTGSGDETTITGPRGRVIGSLAPDRLSAVLHPKRWWNWLIGNPAGYLPDGSVLRLVRIDLAPARYISGVPSWMAGWEFLFLVIATLASLATKFALRVE